MIVPYDIYRTLRRIHRDILLELNYSAGFRPRAGIPLAPPRLALFRPHALQTLTSFMICPDFGAMAWRHFGVLVVRQMAQRKASASSLTAFVIERPGVEALLKPSSEKHSNWPAAHSICQGA